MSEDVRMIPRSDRSRRSSELFGILAMLVHTTSRDAAAILARNDLNPAKFQLMLSIAERPGSSQRELSEGFGVTGGNISLLIAKLEASGLIRRVPAGAANQIWLTEVGERLIARLEPEYDTFLLDRFDRLTDPELDQFHRLAGLAGR